MALPTISPSLAQDETYKRINDAITEAGKVSGKADTADVSAAAALAAAAAEQARASATSADLAAKTAPPSLRRPGDGARAFTFVSSLATLGGEADALASLDISKIAFAATGGVARIVGLGILAAREAEPIEPGRIREVRAVLRRQANASDPSNDTVRVGLLWLDQAKSPLPGPAFSVIADLNALLTASGRQEVKAYVAAAAGDGVTIVAPAGAAYFRRFVYNFGLDGATDIETLASTDVTGQAIPPAVTTDFQNRLAAQESLNPGPRLNAIEAQLQNPNSLTYATRSDAAAATVPATVTTIVTRGLAAAGDGKGSTYRRGTLAEFNAALPGTAFRSADGAYWLRIDKGVRGYDLSDDALEAAARKLMFRRKVEWEIPFCPGVIQDALKAAPHNAQNERGYITGLATDMATKRLFTTSAYTNSAGVGKAVHCCYSVANPAAPVLLSWWLTGQYSREGIAFHKINGREYIYQLGDKQPLRVDITSLPAAGSTITYDGTYSKIFSDVEESYFEITPLGGGRWMYMSNDAQNPGGAKHKPQFLIYQESGTDGEIWTKVGETRLHMSAIGSYLTNIQNFLVKGQGIDFWKGRLYVGCGGDYFSGSSSAATNRLLQVKQQGITEVSMSGDLLAAALCDPAVALTLTGSQIGRTITVHECEGIRSDATDGKLRACWNTIAGADWSGLGRTKGVVITQECCSDADAVDYSVGQTGLQTLFDGRSRSITFPKGRAAKHPITGGALDTVTSIIALMIDTGTVELTLSGYNNTILDLNGEAIPHGNGLIRFDITVNAACIITAYPQSGGAWNTVIGNIGGYAGGGRTQVPAKVRTGTTGIQYGGDAAGGGPPTVTNLSGYTLDPAGRMHLNGGAASPLGVARTNDGFVAAVYRAGAVVGGVYSYVESVRLYTAPNVFFGSLNASPEGNIVGGVGSVITRTDTGQLYRKTSGTGNTGWVTP